MRSFSLGSTLVLASLLFSMAAYAQTAGKPEAANSQGEATASGLSGIWLTRAPRGVGWYNYALAGPDVPTDSLGSRAIQGQQAVVWPQ